MLPTDVLGKECIDDQRVLDCFFRSRIWFKPSWQRLYHAS